MADNDYTSMEKKSSGSFLAANAHLPLPAQGNGMLNDELLP